MSEREAYAYDPVRNEDVQITCDHDMPHDFGVTEAVAEDDRHLGGTEDDAKANPRLVAADLSHDPIEACQGTYTHIVDEDCPVCGYDRCDRTVHTMAGVTRLTCRRCGAKSEGRGDWSPPETDRQRLAKEKEWSEKAGWLGTGSMFSKGDKPLYRTESGGYLRYWFEHYGEPRTIDPDNALERMLVMLDDGAFGKDDLAELLTEVGNAPHFDPDAMKAIDRCVLAAQLLPDEVNIELTEPKRADDEE